MSFFIDRLEALIQTQITRRTPSARFSKDANPETELGDQEQRKTLLRAMSCLNNQLIQIQCTSQSIIFLFLLSKVYKELSFFLKATFSKKTLETKLTFKLVNPNQTFMSVNSQQRRVFASKIISIFNKLIPHIFNQYKISIQIHSGLIKIQNPTFFSLKNYTNNLPNILQFLIKHFLNNIHNIYQPLLSIIQVSNANPKTYLQDLIMINGGARIKKLLKYSKIMNIMLNLGAQDTHQEQLLNRNILREHESLKALNSNAIPIQKDLLSILLYGNQNETFANKSAFVQLQYSLTDDERDEIKTRLEIPQVSAMLEGNQRSFIVNHIKLAKKINEKSMNKIAVGGFASIFLAEVEYYPVPSYPVDKQDEMKKQPKDLLNKKVLIVKRQAKLLPKQMRSRLLHEKQILLKIKTALSIFTPKYYFVVNQPQQENQDLLIQHVNLHSSTFSLEDYVKKFKASLSQQTIIYFAYMILQGLRYLKDYQITHLDLKLSNIMIGKKLAVKLIDFGQSYHPSIKSHRPGVSMPYSPPESYKNKGSFNHKSDVYSFGVILHYLLASKFPFYVYSEKSREELQYNQTLTDRWFFTPEGLTYYGQKSIFPFLQLLIGKCLHPDPKCRPQFQWITLILREYMQYFR